MKESNRVGGKKKKMGEKTLKRKFKEVGGGTRRTERIENKGIRKERLKKGKDLGTESEGVEYEGRRKRKEKEKKKENMP